jgi:hypothetical protein
MAIGRARVVFLARTAAHAADIPREIARKRVGGKSFSARAVFPPPLEQRGSACARQTGDFFCRAGLLARLLEMLLARGESEGGEKSGGAVARLIGSSGGAR